MKLPGTALLRLDVSGSSDGGGSRLAVTALFKPRGLLGIAYWYSVLPLHVVVFRGLLNGLRTTAENAPVR